MRPPFRTSLLFSFLISILPHSFAMANCTGGDSVTACGQRPSCCPAGEQCNLNRGIPVCQNPKYPIISGFVPLRCANRYLSSCEPFDILNTCCPIGTICFTNGLDGVASCVDAYGTFKPSFPSTDNTYSPAQTTIANNLDAGVTIDPPNVWSPQNAPNCSAGSGSLLSTSAVNASISFNFTGTSILIHMIKSPQGGVFSMIVDGVELLEDTIDTYNAGGELCHSVQYPPFEKPPPGYGTRNNHSITLVHKGPSPNAPNGMLSSSVVFGSFAIPQFQVSASTRSVVGGTLVVVGIFSVVTNFVALCLI